MTKSEKRMWLTNIENAGDAVVAEYGSEVVQSVFQRYPHGNQSGIRKNGEESQTYRHTQTIQGRRNNKCQK